MRARLAQLVACALAASALAAGCGSDAEPAVEVPSPVEARRVLKGAPPELAALHRQAADLLGGGEPAFARRLAQLQGHPVVVNAWATWCDPCKLELPFFQRAAVGYGKRVAFLGVDVDDASDKARAFLREHWIAYPSYVDEDERIARSIGVTAGLPTTVFYDRRGEVAYVHQGQYRDAAALVRDIERYALGS